MNRPNRLPTLSAKRVSLRWLGPEDVDALYSIFSHPEVVRYWSSPALPDRDGAERLLREIHECFRSGRLFQWGVERTDRSGVIGTCTAYYLAGMGVTPAHILPVSARYGDGLAETSEHMAWFAGPSLP